mmetsp:Transcript_1610/g.7167  ORF Transcript_1610/g.7167 Transcript_1610/m.7167 type:complete len:262 (+) Transcript_1610:4343-5128(+)
MSLSPTRISVSVPHMANTSTSSRELHDASRHRSDTADAKPPGSLVIWLSRHRIVRRFGCWPPPRAFGNERSRFPPTSRSASPRAASRDDGSSSREHPLHHTPVSLGWNRPRSVGSHSRSRLLLQQSSRSSRHALRLTGSDRSLLEAQSSRASALQPERLGSARSALPLTSRCSKNISAPIPSGSDSSRLQLSSSLSSSGVSCPRSGNRVSLFRPSFSDVTPWNPDRNESVKDVRPLRVSDSSLVLSRATREVRSSQALTSD